MGSAFFRKAATSLQYFVRLVLAPEALPVVAVVSLAPDAVVVVVSVFLLSLPHAARGLTNRAPQSSRWAGRIRMSFSRWVECGRVRWPAPAHYGMS